MPVHAHLHPNTRLELAVKRRRHVNAGVRRLIDGAQQHQGFTRAGRLAQLEGQRLDPGGARGCDRQTFQRQSLAFNGRFGFADGRPSLVELLGSRPFDQGRQRSTCGFEFALGLVTRIACRIELAFAGQAAILQPLDALQFIAGRSQCRFGGHQAGARFVDGFLARAAQQLVQTTPHAVGGCLEFRQIGLGTAGVLLDQDFAGFDLLALAHMDGDHWLGQLRGQRHAVTLERADDGVFLVSVASGQHQQHQNGLGAALEGGSHALAPL